LFIKKIDILFILESNLKTSKSRNQSMKTFTAVVERCPDTGLYIGFIPGFPGAHTQGESLDEINKNLKEVIEMLLEDGPPELETEFVGTQTVLVV